MTLGIPATPREELEYPSSDGEPMAETPIHGEAMVAAMQDLARFFEARQDVAVGMNMLFYYEKGNSKARFAPDVYVAIGARKRLRRTYKTWEEPVPPTVVFEMSSRGTWLEDAGNKKTLCARLGVAEYFLFDPEGEYLEPPLQGFRLSAGHYEPIVEAPDGSLESRALELRLRTDGELIRFMDGAGEPLPHTKELVQSARAAEAKLEAAASELEAAVSKRKEAETKRTEAEKKLAQLEARALAAEAELERLRRERG